MNPALAVSLLAAASVALSLCQWLSGFAFTHYLVWLSATAIGMMSGLLLLLSVPAAIIYLLVGLPHFRQRIVYVLATMAIAWLPSLLPSQIDGFEHRIGLTDEAEWLRLADDARAVLRASSPDGKLPARPAGYFNDRYVRQLAPRHPLLTLSEQTPKLFVTEDVVGVWWGSGLTGTLGVEVFADPGDQKAGFDGWFTRRAISEQLGLVWD